VVLFEKNSCPFVVKNNPLPGDAELQLRTLRE